MSEAGDYTAGVWTGHDFGKARAAYDTSAGRGYADAVTAGIKASDLVPAVVETESTTPLIIFCDVTGSMGAWPATIFSKLPYLEHETKHEYLGEDTEICFGAVGDADCDNYPLQVQPFAKGLDLKASLEKLKIEGGGGGDLRESYELGALYVTHNVKTPKALRKPIFIFIGDEMPKALVSPTQAKNVAKVDIKANISAEDIFRDVAEKYSVYLIQKPYSDSPSRHDYPEIAKRWNTLLKEERIADLADPNRVVDVIFGILAAETGRIGYFKKELEDRQTDAQVDTVYRALATIHKTKALKASNAKTSKSTFHKPPKGTKTKDLI